MRAWRIDRNTIALVVDFGERRFRGYAETLGAPAARYFEKGGRESARQWNLHRKANFRLYVPVSRLLRGKPDGEVVTLAPKRGAERRAA